MILPAPTKVKYAQTQQVLQHLDPDDADGHSSSSAAPLQSTVGVMTGDSVAQIATIVARVMGELQTQMASTKVEDVDRHLQSFLRLQPPHF